MARQKATGGPRNTKLVVYLTSEQLEGVRSAADRSNLSTSTWAMMQLVKAAG